MVDLWGVSERDVENARSLEPLFEPHEGRISDPPKAGRHCISPVLYPHIWREEP